MTEPAPLVHLSGIEKKYGGLRPLRVTTLRVAAGERLTLSGFDVGAAETLVHLITGASVPDAGDVRVDGRSTRDIATDTDWLASLDRFGIVTDRAVLLGSLSIAANLALPITVSIDPMSPEVRAAVEQLAAGVGLDAKRLDAKASTMSALERMRAHVARATAVGPTVLLLEHPTAVLEPDDAHAFGTMLRALADARGLAWIVLTEDEAFANAAGGTRLRLDPATGDLRPIGGLFRRFGFALGKR